MLFDPPQTGVYTPTLYNTTNVAASTAYQCQYCRVGDMVFVSGKVSIDGTAAAATLLGLDIPIASNFGAAEDLGGSASCGTFQQSIAIYADVANNRASFTFLIPAIGGAANLDYSFKFMYRII